ncbi:MAG: pyridoxal phosphate-dependent aminotransferase [Peptostreptococcaceae bacterium]|jgi:aspartate aminotransferase|nr:pyridoxal phosphate-dependent aminotransferase [Peptostreptococcaceae bacterium]
MNLSKKHEKISPSLTLAISAKAKKMVKEGKDVISFGVGEPDFKTPENIRKRAMEVLEEGKIGYTPASGLMELKEAIKEKLLKDNNLEFDASDIVVSNGAKHSLYNTFQAILNEGDEVIVAAPYWVSYPELIKMAGGKPVIVKCSEANEFKFDIDELKNAINDKTKAIILNSPSNPTGSVYDKEELEAIAKLAIEKDLFIVSDEIYEKLIYEGKKHISIASLSKEIKDRTIVINGMSKAYAMTGWRIGYTASNTKIAKLMSNIQSHATSNPSTIGQYASIEALKNSANEVEAMRLEFDKRRKNMIELINNINNLSCIAPKGAFYVMVNISKVKGSKINGKDIETSMDFANELLEKSNVAVVPGIAFGDDDFIRLSYANSMENIVEGIKRIENFLNL